MDEKQIKEDEVFCDDCGSILKSENEALSSLERTKCNDCGSKARLIKINLHDSLLIYDDVSMIGSKKKETGGKKIVFKGKYGTELHHDSNTLQERIRTFDYLNDVYHERINNNTLQFFKEVNDSISNHQGHGSAKIKKQIL